MLPDPGNKHNTYDNICDLLIISCLQCIVLDEQNEAFDYKFYGYEGTARDRNGKQFVQAALKNDQHTYYALQMFWVKRAIYRMHFNTGDGVVVKALAEFERICLNVIQKLLGCSSIREMYDMDIFYSKLLNKCLQFG